MNSNNNQINTSPRQRSFTPPTPLPNPANKAPVISASPQVHTDSVNHPQHYCSHPSGIECIEIARHYCFSIGNAFKYLWRAGLKEEVGVFQIDKEIEDLEKASWYIQDRINQLKAKKNEEA